MQLPQVVGAIGLYSYYVHRDLAKMWARHMHPVVKQI